MTTEISLVLFILGIAIVLFASERIRVDVVSMMVMLALLLSGLVTTEEAFSGFSSPAVITVWAIYIISASLTFTGIADFIGNQISKIPGIQQEARLILGIMVTVGVMSAFMNNIGATAVLLPVTISLGKKANISPSKLLIPLAFGSLLGGVTTLIGTPPNLLASNALLEAGYEPFTLFDYTPMGIIVMACGVLYFVIVGRHLLPNYAQSTHPETSELTEEYQIQATLAELRVNKDSSLMGKTIAESQFGQAYDMTVMGLLRAEPLHMGDTLLVHGHRNQIEALRDDHSFLFLHPPTKSERRLNKAPINLIIFVAMIVSVATGFLHISVAAVLAAILSVLTNCLDMDEAYQSIEWKSVFLIAGMLPMGVAMEKTGTVLVAPIAISAAVGIGVDPRAFVMGVGIAASNSFMFPIGHQASVLVYAPGGYRFFDYTKVGLPLTILIWILMVIFLPVFWPL